MPSIRRLHLLYLPLSCWLARYQCISICDETNILASFINCSFICIKICAFLVACCQVVAITVLLLNGTGPRCNEDVNECKKNPCKNGGRCINSQGSYVCKCQPGYSGHDCQIDIDDCTPSKCFPSRSQCSLISKRYKTALAFV